MTAPPRPSFLLFGRDGQVGYELATALAPLGRVTALARADADLVDAGALRAAVRRARPQVVLNAAAYTAVDAAENDGERCRAVNGVAPGVIAAAAEEVGAAVVHFSTDYVFDGALGRPYVEDDAPNPLNRYGATKLEGEIAVAAASSAYLTLRLGWVYGLRGRNFLATIRRLARDRDELAVVCDQLGAPTWSRAIAAAVARLLREPVTAADGAAAAIRASRGVYHLGAAGETSWHGFASAIVAADAARGDQRCRRVRAIATAEYPAAARRPPYSVLNSERAAATFGVRLADWREQLRQALGS